MEFGFGVWLYLLRFEVRFGLLDDFWRYELHGGDQLGILTALEIACVLCIVGRYLQQVPKASRIGTVEGVDVRRLPKEGGLH